MVTRPPFALPGAAMSSCWTYTDPEPRLLRALLRAGRDQAGLQDQIDCAELAALAGLREEAAVLFGLVILQLGRPRGLALAADVNVRLGLWPDIAGSGVPAAQAGFPVDVAIAEIREFIELRVTLGERPVDLKVLPPGDIGLPPLMTAITEEMRQVGALATDFLRALPAALAAGEGWSAGLLALADDLLRVPIPPVEEYMAAGLDQSVELFVLGRLQAFLNANHDLLNADAAGAVPFEWAAEQPPSALGPYLNNLARICRTARDVFMLYDAAAEGEPDPVALEIWSVIASAQMSGPMLIDLIDELGDRGMVTALNAVLLRAARTSRLDKPLEIVWRIRDVGLDLGDQALSMRAQSLVVRWRWHDPNERIILGDIALTFGDIEAAEAAFESTRLVHPDHSGAAARLALLTEGAVTGVRHGYSSSPARRRLRIARAAAYAAQRSA